MLFKTLMFSSIALVMSGCGFGPSVGNQSIEYNRSLETASNATILLNILRAKHRQPMHFTVLANVTGSIRISGGANAGIVIGRPDGPRSITPNLSATVGPNFVVNSEISKEFMQGITKPIELETINTYWQQGWSKNLLLYLMVEYIRVTTTTKSKKDGKNNTETDIIVYRNSPKHKKEFEKFKDLLDDFSKRIWVATEYSNTKYGPVLKASQLKRIKYLIKIAKEKLSLVCLRQNIKGKLAECGKDETATHYQLVRKSSRLTLCLDSRQHLSRADGFPSPSEACPTNKKTGRPSGGARNGLIKGFLSVQSNKSNESPNTSKSYELAIRSTQGIIYYLGEILRAADNGHIVRFPATYKERAEKKKGRALFQVSPFPAYGVAPHLTVRHDWKFYGISRDDGRSMQVIALINQLLALHRESDTVTRVTPVTIVGQ